MTQTKPALSADTGGTEITRFNALRHGMLSRYTVLPWEVADEYRALVAALAAEHAPQGPTEEHLVHRHIRKIQPAATPSMSFGHDAVHHPSESVH